MDGNREEEPGESRRFESADVKVSMFSVILRAVC
jgi:hypothetical protein